MSDFFDSVTNFFAKIGQIIAAIKGFFDTVSSVFATLRGVIKQITDVVTSWVKDYPSISVLLGVLLMGITIIILLSIWEALN